MLLYSLTYRQASLEIEGLSNNFLFIPYFFQTRLKMRMSRLQTVAWLAKYSCCRIHSGGQNLEFLSRRARTPSATSQLRYSIPFILCNICYISMCNDLHIPRMACPATNRHSQSQSVWCLESRSWKECFPPWSHSESRNTISYWTLKKNCQDPKQII